MPAVLLAALWLAGCASLADDARRHADTLAEHARLRHERIAAAPFELTAFVRIARPDRPLTVYIEGDGMAWLSRHRPSPDPTPREAMGLRLAAADPGVNVAYLARPCQFTPMTRNAACEPAYWTGKRFGETVVDAMDRALDQLARRVPGQRLELVGYSGGGAIAVLLAARRRDVAAVHTVAGNLDTEFVNRLHGVSPMPDSLNPADVAPRIAALPQHHVAGADDAVVPPEVARRFVGAQCGPAQRCAAVLTVVPGMRHDGDWPRHWRALLPSLPSRTSDADAGPGSSPGDLLRPR